MDRNKLARIIETVASTIIVITPQSVTVPAFVSRVWKGRVRWLLAKRNKLIEKALEEALHPLIVAPVAVAGIL